MAPAGPPTEITLKVKVPPGTVDGGADDVALGTLDASTTVGSVRQRLQEIIPSHPSPERQRLLYGGRVLVDDEQTLADALNVKRDPSQLDYVIHMIVKGDGFNASSIRSSSTGPAAAQPSVRIVRQQDGSTTTPAPLLGSGVPEHARILFDRAVAVGQQQRAAMGMHGVTGHPVGHPAPGTASNASQMPEGPQPGNRSHNQQAANAPNMEQHAPPRAVSSQGFHVQGVGPDGQRFQMHRQTFNIPVGQQLPQMAQLPNMLNMQHMPPHIQMPHMPPHLQMPHIPHAPQGPFMHARPVPAPTQPQPHPRMFSALDQARNNMTEMRRILAELRDGDNASEEQQNRIRDVERRAQAINEYIDPFHLANHSTSSRSPTTSGVPQQVQQGQRAQQQRLNTPPPPLVFPPGLLSPRLHNPTTSASNQNTSEVTCYLLSSPQGPQALLFSPQYGTFSNSNNLASAAIPFNLTQTTTDTRPANDHREQDLQLIQRPDPVAEAAHQQAQDLQQGQAQAQAQAQDGGPAQALLGHFWLLFRILIFAYFLLGSDLGWRRPLALAAIGLGFWLMRLGLFADGGMARRWWDGIMAVPPRQGQRPAMDQGVEAAGGAGAGVGRAAMPTPEQLAERLLAERDRARNGRWNQIRELARPVERATALFIASLWPGVGEAQVQATEREERRRQEEETNARRREEEEVH